MKFFIMLQNEPVKNDAMFYPHVYGPFETDDQVSGEMKARWPNDKAARFVVFEGDLRGVPANPLEKPESEKREPGNEGNWMKLERLDRWVCRTCNAVIMAAKVAHPIHDGPFVGAGSGECRYEDVGYCPNCEKKPSFHGSPVSS